MMSLPKESIKKFYDGSEIFVTGGSGYLGRVLIEKLLRSCNGVKKIYLLMRAKKGVEANKRVEQLTDCKLFELLKSTDASALDKLHVVEGDSKNLRLGLSDADYESLKNCSIVFHCAASVRFDDPISHAILLNTRGTREVCKLATEMKNLKAFIHVSTTFIQPKLFGAEEIFYPADCDWMRMIEFAEKFDVDLMCGLEKKLTKCAPNTYTFSKHLSEQVCQHYKECKNLPIVIYRPSIICGSQNDPIPGWMDNLNGPTAIMFGSICGINHVSHINGNRRLDCIPVDMCVKGMIISALKVWKTNSLTTIIPVYNACGIVNFSFDTTKNYTGYLDNPPLIAIMYQDSTFAKCAYRAWIIRFVEQIIPAIFFDGLLMMAGQRTKLLKLQRKIYEAYSNLKTFTSRDFHFSNIKYLDLNEEIPVDEKDDFLIDTENLLMYQNADDTYKIVLEVLFNQTADDAARARKRYKFVQLISRTYQILAYCGLLYCIYKFFLI